MTSSLEHLTLSDEKERAYQWLVGLHSRLDATLPEPATMRTKINEMVEHAKATGNKVFHGPEYAFLNGFVVPTIFEYMQRVDGITQDAARESFLSEWYRGLPQYHSKSPARELGHPFEKSRRESKAIMQRWRGQELGSNGKPRKPFHQACPDLGLSAPFPHKIIFEAKYFRDGEDAETQLVNGIYEAFYYLSMPKTCASKAGRGWQYDFACFLAFDASKSATLCSAWHSIHENVRREFWEGGHLFIMIVRPPNGKTTSIN